jgi:glycosyltransferase involved in cell wall biosynthesis
VLESVDVGRKSIGDYEATAGREALERLRSLAEPLKGARILHLNSTPYGGGVAEILRSEVLLLRDLGLEADWKIIPPAIDPESPKNIELPSKIAERILGWLGVELGKPLLTQVSRFDPWKDQTGVIEAYRLVKEEVPDLKLALVGSMALDDPEGWEVYRQIKDAAREDSDIDIFTNLTGVSNVEVNAFQRFSDVCVQKSIREGFGLVVSETLWKGTPMVAGEAGGIPLQMQDGAGGFLVDSVEECAERVLRLLQNPEEGEELALWGKEIVRERFLLTRLIADELPHERQAMDSPHHSPDGGESCDSKHDSANASTSRAGKVRSIECQDHPWRLG